MTRPITALGAALGPILCAGLAAAGCAESPAPCSLPEGTYHILLPEGAKGAPPAVLLLHGYGGEGTGFMRNAGIAGAFLDRGYAVIAADGQPRANGKGRSWDFHPDRPATRDETAFLIAVADDAAVRHGVRRDAILLAGFSIGGSMTSYAACAAPAAFAAYAPVAGSFWRPHPESCAGPVRLFHTHGTADGTVPLQGRQIMPGFVQGNVPEAMEIWSRTNRCTAKAEAEAAGLYSLDRWTGCAPGSDLVFALHPGGHSIPKGWATLVIDWFETR